MNDLEIKRKKEIESKYYMNPILGEFNKRVKSKEDYGKIFSYLHEILVNSKSKIDDLLEKRKERGEIKDVSQARRSIAGAAFSNLVEYLFYCCKEKNLIRENIFITTKPKSDELIADMVTINVGNETQKPDMDIAIYSLHKDGSLNKCFIISLKTSLRERAGQTYKWKLLLEIATTENTIKDKYEIIYNHKEMPLVGFATVNFYNEINNPQHRGMFQFFDKSFIAKPLNEKFISPLSDLPEYVNKVL